MKIRNFFPAICFGRRSNWRVSEKVEYFFIFNFFFNDVPVNWNLGRFYETPIDFWQFWIEKRNLFF